MTATSTAPAPTPGVYIDDVYVADMYAVIMANLDNGFRLGTEPATDTALIGKTITAMTEVHIENGFTSDRGVRFNFTDGTSYTLVYPTPAPF